MADDRRYGKPLSKRPGKANLSVIGGMSVFTVVVVLLTWGVFQKNTISLPLAAHTDEPSSQISPAPSAVIPETPHATATVVEPSKQEQEILNELAASFSDAVPKLAKEITSDKLFLAAAGKASYTDPYFDAAGVTFNLLLPDPGEASLDKLGLSPYEPHSGAQAYIAENYAKLCLIDKTDRITYQVTLPFQNGIAGEKTVDWTLQPVGLALYEYSRVFEPHVEQYMSDMGFYRAATEILMPDFQDWTVHQGSDKGAPYLDAYYKDLAKALAFEGVYVNRKITVDKSLIETVLKRRFGGTWAFDRLSIETEDFQPYLAVNSITHISFFTKVYDRMSALYQSGNLTPPSSFTALENAYLAESRQQADSMFGDLAAGKQGTVTSRRYAFLWDELGKKGISACPDLVYEIRTFLYSCDFDLMFLADSLGVNPD